MITKTLTVCAALFMAVVLVVTCLHTTPLSYLYCLMREPEWLKSKTRGELESRLVAFYSVGPVDPAMTVWNHQPLKEGQSTIRYLIFGREPLDAIVSNDGTIVDIFTAYE